MRAYKLFVLHWLTPKCNKSKESYGRIPCCDRVGYRFLLLYMVIDIHWTIRESGTVNDIAMAHVTPVSAKFSFNNFIANVKKKQKCTGWHAIRNVI